VAGPDLHPERGDVGDVAVHHHHHLVGEPERRDEPQRAAGPVLGLEDGDRVAEPGEVVGCGQAGRARADDGHALLVPVLGRAELGLRMARVVVVRGEPLEPADGERTLQLAPRAGALAGGVAHPPQGAREGSRLQDELQRLVEQAASDQGDVPVGLDPRRAREAAG